MEPTQHGTASPAARLRLRREDKKVIIFVDDYSALPLPSKHGQGSEDQFGEQKLEWILVLRIESSFADLRSPSFANSVRACLPSAFNIKGQRS